MPRFFAASLLFATVSLVAAASVAAGLAELVLRRKPSAPSAC